MKKESENLGKKREMKKQNELGIKCKQRTRNSNP